MSEPPNVRLEAINSAENVVLVRAALTGLAEAIGLDGSDLVDLQTAATEACNNVVQHAYGGEAGPLEVELRVAPGKLDLLVRDEGAGIRPRETTHSHEQAGIGLPVIQALSHRSEFRERSDGGTEVWSEFAAAGIRCPAPLAATPAASASPPAPPVTLALGPTAVADPTPVARDEVALALAPTELALAILPRVLCVLAARAHFSSERLAEVQGFARQLVAESEGKEGAAFRLRASVERRALELTVGTRRLRLGDPREDEGAVAY
jgi:serine/threonine-protein kinase RsbW